MTKSELKKTIEKLNHFSNQWVKFRNFLYPEMVNPALEGEFTQIKSDITTGHRDLLSVLEFDIEVAQTMLDSVGRITSPRSGETLTSAARKRLEEEWNSAYILIQETIGLMEYRLEEKSQFWNPVNMVQRMGEKRTEETPNFITVSRSGIGVRKMKNSAIFQLIMALLSFGIVLAALIFTGALDQYFP
jgi:hypothetical protein